jgi:hypothetical protein
MKSLLINALIAFILIISMGSTMALAQDTPAPKDQPVDESAIIFAGCRLSVLVKENATDPTKALTPEQKKGTETNIIVGQKQKYIQGCVQEIIRFIIVIASLAAILKIAASGVAMLDPTGSKMSSKLSSKSTITNLVIGLFLLIVGWNLIPILNQSFNNVDFLNLPGVNYCAADQACVSEYSTLAKESKKAFETYKQAEKDKKATLNDKQRLEIIAGIKAYCDNKGKAATDLTRKALEAEQLINAANDKICTEKYAENLAAWMKKGDSNLGDKDGGDAGVPDSIDKLTVDYKDAISKYALAVKDKKAQGDLIKAADVIIGTCSTEKIKIFEDTKKDITNADGLKDREKIIANCKILSGTDSAAIKLKLKEFEI